MPYTTLVAGNVITASWANASVRDQVVTPFASASARDSAITVPVEGMLSFLADSDSFVWYDGSAWQGLDAPGWTSYSPTWTGASSDPVIDNGTITGAYRRVPGSDLVVVTGRILMGSATTYGSGRWIVSLPVTATDATVGAGSAVCYDASVSTGERAAVCWFNSSTTLRFSSSGGEVGASSPFTWATSDQLRWTFMYEATP